MHYFSQPQLILPPIATSDQRRGGLWISGLLFATKTERLKDKQIAAVCSIMSQPLAFPPSIEHKQILVQDSKDEDIEPYFKAFEQFVDEQLGKGRNLLVHCVAGISRSAAFCIYYLMTKYRLSYESAFGMVKKARPIIKLNPGFERILRQLDIRFEPKL